MNNHYEALGVPFDASPEQIRKAYKSLAQKNHPDKGGSQAHMQAIQKAYDILSDELRRARYDAGEPDEAPTPKSQAPGLLAALLDLTFNQMLEKSKDVRYTNVIGVLRNALNTEIGEHVQGQRQMVRRIQMCREAQARLVCFGAADYMRAAIDEQLRALEAQMKKIEFFIEMRREALNLLADYEYTVDLQVEAVQQPPTGGFYQSTTWSPGF